MRALFQVRLAYAIAILVVGGWAIDAHSEESARRAGEWPSGAGAPCLDLARGDVIVATVRKVSTHAATHGSPPRLELEVHEVLRGDSKADRRRAVWEPQPHDVDWAGSGAKEAIAAWKAMPMADPRVGEKWILWGEVAADDGQAAFRVFSQGRTRFSDEGRARAAQTIQDAAAWKRAYEAKVERDRTALAEAKAKWRAQVSAEDIGRYVVEADFVGIGRICSGPARQGEELRADVQIATILKGQRRRTDYPPDAYYLTIAVPEPLCPLLDQHTEYVFFLSENGMGLGPPSPPFYPRIRSGDGLVVADAASLKAAREASQRASAEVARRPVIVLEFGGTFCPAAGSYYDYCWKIGTPFVKAAEGRFTILRSYRFQQTQSQADLVARAGQLKKAVPDAVFFLFGAFQKPEGAADTAATLSVTAARLGPNRNPIVFEAEWPMAGEKAMSERAAEAIQKLSECRLRE